MTKPSKSRRVATGIALALALFALSVGVGACVLAAPQYSGPKTDHFDGERFHNNPRAKAKGFSDLFKWQKDRKRGPWREWTNSPRGKKPPASIPKGELRVTFINHATTLVQMDEVNIITDPIYSERASPVSFAGPKRVRPPGIRFDDLPKIHAILISHNHYDHMDLPTLRRLAERDKPKIFVGLGNAKLLEDAGIEGAVDLDWWQSAKLDDSVTVYSAQVQHFSGRSLNDRGYTLWTGFVVRGPAGNVYFAGDTGYGAHFAEARKRLGPFRLAILPIGAYKPRWFMHPIHVSPAEAVQAHIDLGAATSVAMHFGTFNLADDGQNEPIRDLALALGQAAVTRADFWVLGFGEGRDVPRIGERYYPKTKHDDHEGHGH